MGKIATEEEAYSIGKVGTAITNKCCTKVKAEELGCDVSGTYTNQQLVQKDDLSKPFGLKSVNESILRLTVDSLENQGSDSFNKYLVAGSEEASIGGGIEGVISSQDRENVYVNSGQIYYGLTLGIYEENFFESEWIHTNFEFRTQFETNYNESDYAQEERITFSIYDKWGLEFRYEAVGTPSQVTTQYDYTISVTINGSNIMDHYQRTSWTATVRGMQPFFILSKPSYSQSLEMLMNNFNQPNTGLAPSLQIDESSFNSIATGFNCECERVDVTLVSLTLESKRSA